MTHARSVATLVLLAALVAPSTAPAHHPAGQLTAAERHRAADLAGVSVRKLERRVNAIARRLGYRPGTRRTAMARAAAVGDPGTVGSWSGVIPAPVVPIFSALLPSGKILMWDSVGDNPAESYTTHNFTRAALYDPVTDTSKRVDVAGYNIFCAGRAQRFQAGAYDVLRGNLGVIGNDLARSLDVAPGYEATLCRDAGLTGGCTTLGAGRYNTLPAGYDLAVSSLRVRAL
jgi:hypothetical protein